MSVPTRILLASSNPGKLREYRELAWGSDFDIDLLPNYHRFAPFDESASTFAENSAGKALHYSRLADELILADDSGLVVPALGGRPGVHSARYGGPGSSDADSVRRLLGEMDGKEGPERRGRFICVISVARRNRVIFVVSDSVEGEIATEARGTNGFGYDAVFCLPDSGRSYAQLSAQEKNRESHRAKAFRKLRDLFRPERF
jgi:XTP/dITP diphosphohydrolase